MDDLTFFQDRFRSIVLHKIYIICSFILFFLLSCSGPIRKIGADASGSGPSVYAIDYQKAEALCLQSMMAVFPDIPFQKASLPEPYIRYQANMRVALDHHTVVVTAMPRFKASDDNRNIVGYYFEVSDHGSLIIQGPQRASALAEYLNTSLGSFSKAVQ